MVAYARSNPPPVPDAVTIIPVSVGAASYALFGFVKDAMVVVSLSLASPEINTTITPPVVYVICGA